jgi:hypothetical protein
MLLDLRCGILPKQQAPAMVLAGVLAAGKAPGRWHTTTQRGRKQMTSRIVHTAYRYKRPPRRKKPVAIEVPEVVKAADPAKAGRG